MHIDPLMIFSTVFVAELGDKTQLGALAVSMRTRNISLAVISCLLGLALATVISVAIGTTLGGLLDRNILMLVGGAVFILFGILSLVSRNDEAHNFSGGVISNSLVIFLLELGDKTQISIVILSALYGDPFVAFLLAIFAFLVVTLITVVLGCRAGRHLDERKTKFLVSALFVFLGIFLILSSLSVVSI